MSGRDLSKSSELTGDLFPACVRARAGARRVRIGVQKFWDGPREEQRVPRIGVRSCTKAHLSHLSRIFS